MSYSYEARRLFQHGLLQQAAGVEPISAPVAINDLESKVALRSDESIWAETCENIDELIEDIVTEYGDTLGSWKRTLSSMFHNQVIAAVVAIDDQGQSNMTNVTTFQTILEAVSFAYSDIETRNQFWPDEFGQCRRIVVDIVDFLIEKCREISAYYWCTPSTPMCTIDMQRTLERAFIIKQFADTPLPAKVELFHEAFSRVYRDCCSMLWSGAYKPGADSDDSDSSDEYDDECQCRISLKQHNKMAKSEQKCRELQLKARNRQFGGPRIVPIPRKKGIRRRKVAPSPLRRATQLGDCDEMERGRTRRSFRRRRWFAASYCPHTRGTRGKYSCSICNS